MTWRLWERQARIIPARAGFTRPVRSGPSWLTDHPRSRGVYDGSGLSRMREQGSSPLARGLLAVGVQGEAGAGIIPARAGFTYTD